MLVMYADILFVINTYVTYALLRSCALVARVPVGRFRAVVSSLLGGGFALVVLIDGISNVLLTVFRLIFSVFLLFAAFYPFDKRKFLRLFGSFFLVNFVFAGLMLAIELFAAPQSMLLSVGIVYFDIDALTLVVLTAVCYCVLSVINLLIKAKAPSGTVFNVTIEFGKSCFSCRALLDTGNTLFEPFSSFPVIVAERNIFGESFSVPDEKLRLVPCSCVTNEGVLRAFRPDKLTVSSPNGKFETDSVYIAITDEKIKNSDFKVLLHPQLVENIQEGKNINVFKTKT